MSQNVVWERSRLGEGTHWPSQLLSSIVITQRYNTAFSNWMLKINANSYDINEFTFYTEPLPVRIPSPTTKLPSYRWNNCSYTWRVLITCKLFMLLFILFTFMLFNPLVRFNSKSDRSAMERFFYFIFTFYFLLYSVPVYRTVSLRRTAAAYRYGVSSFSYPLPQLFDSFDPLRSRLVRSKKGELFVIFIQF